MGTAAARVNISVPLELKDRMAEASASNVINWSAVARHGIESALANLARVPSNHSAAIARLRASRLEWNQQERIKGAADGRCWAELFAEYRALKRLHRSFQRSPDLWHRPWARIRKAVDPYDEHTDEEVSAHLFFGDRYSDCPDYPGYLTAFIEGALATWEAVGCEVD